VDDGVCVHVLRRDSGAHNFFHHLGAQFLEADLGAVLHGDHHRVHPQGNASAVLNLVLAGYLSILTRLYFFVADSHRGAESASSILFARYVLFIFNVFFSLSKSLCGEKQFLRPYFFLVGMKLKLEPPKK
jgi:hypothetical protein